MRQTKSDPAARDGAGAFSGEISTPTNTEKTQEPQGERLSFFGSRPVVQELADGRFLVGFRGAIPFGFAHQADKTFGNIAAAEKHRHYLTLQLENGSLKDQLRAERKTKARLLERVAQLMAAGRIVPPQFDQDGRQIIHQYGAQHGQA